MTPKQFEIAIRTAGLSQRSAGIFFDVNERTVRRWVAGDDPLPRPVALLMRVMHAKKLSADKVIYNMLDPGE